MPDRTNNEQILNTILNAQDFYSPEYHGWIHNPAGNMIGTYEPAGSLYVIHDADQLPDPNDYSDGDVLLSNEQVFLRTYNGTWECIAHANVINLEEFDDIKSEKYEEEENTNPLWDKLIAGEEE